MKFIEVLGIPCNSDGASRFTNEERFYLNVSLIGAIKEGQVMLKGGSLLCVNGKFFKNVRFVNQDDFKKLLEK